MFGPSGILSNETLTALSSVGPILSLKQLESIVGENWPWFGKYGDNLLTQLISLNIPPMIPKPPNPKRTKRTATNKTSEGQDGGGKRRRVLPDNQATPTPVNLVNVPGPSSTIPTLSSHPFYPYPSPSTPVRPPPISTSPIYQNPYYSHYTGMTPAPSTTTPMSYYPDYIHPFPTPSPLAAIPANSRQVTQTSQPTLFEFRHYNPESRGSSTSRYYNPS
jgi:hypothetical protein